MDNASSLSMRQSALRLLSSLDVHGITSFPLWMRLDLNSSVAIASDFEFRPMELGFHHALFGFVLWQVAQWIYSQITMSDMQRKSTPLKLPPYSLPVLGSTIRAIVCTPWYLDMVTDLMELYENRSFGVFVVGAPDNIFVSTPEMFEDVLKTQFECFDRGSFFRDNVHDMLGDGIFSADGATWAQLRKTASNLFSMNALRDSMVSGVHKRIPVLFNVLQRGVEANQPIDLAKLFSKFTMEVFAEIGFGVDLGCLATAQEHPFEKAFDAAQAIIFVRFVRPAWFWKTMRWLNVGRERELKSYVKTVNDVVLGIISESLEHRVQQQNQAPQEKTKTHPNGRNIVSLFLDNVSNDEGGEINPTILRDIVLNFLLAGRDTTAEAMSWFFYLLNQYPEVEQKIREELAIKIPQLVSGEIDAPTMDQAASLVYLEAALKETLRLYPSVPANFCQANRDTVLCDGTFVKKGTCVAMSSYAMGRSQLVWGVDAKVFNPMRWIEPESGRLRPVSPFKFCAFGAGPRRCMGVNMAINELKIVTASILARFHLQMLPGQCVTYEPSITLPMKNPLFVRAQPL